MKREKAEMITEKYLKPVYGFALKRCASPYDAEDIAQEIALRVFRALLLKDDLVSPEKFVWTIAHNTLSNYYRSKSKTALGIPFEDVFENLISEDNTADEVIEREAVDRLYSEIAYLSKTQRRIVISYYFENKKQETIAKELGIPLGTVKWYLFEAKKDLKKGMEIMREASELKFNPVKFEFCTTNGAPGEKGANSNFFRSIISQNIVYSVWKEDKTVNEIAECLGISPVYVEDEANYLAEYGFLLENKGKYRCNILIDEDDDEIVSLRDDIYSRAAGLFANELFDELTASGILKDEGIVCGQTDRPISVTEIQRADENFILWSLIPYITAVSGESLMKYEISSDEAMTLRPDGGRNICSAHILAPGVKKCRYFDSMSSFCGPCWNEYEGKYILWTLDTEWSESRVDDRYIDNASRILSLFFKDELSIEEYAFLSEMGVVKTNGDYEGNFKASWQFVWLENNDIKGRLIAIGDRIKEKYWQDFEKLKISYVKAVLDRIPRHLHKMRRYELQYMFFSDGWFILHCLKELVNNNKLKLPTEEQRKSLTMIMTSR